MYVFVVVSVVIVEDAVCMPPPITMGPMSTPIFPFRLVICSTVCVPVSVTVISSSPPLQLM